MTEEEYFRKNYPDSCYGDRLLSPHWDFFQAGVEFGERESEKKIKDLTEQNASLLTSVENLNKSVQELEKEIAELKKKNLDTQDAVTMQMYTNKANKEIADKQLSKAKELLKKCYDNYIYLQPLRGDIEQFLNSEVEK